MTVDHARQQSGSEGASRGQQNSRSEMPDTTSAVAVLISLPDLGEPAPEEKMRAAATGALSPRENTMRAPSEPTVESPASEEEPVDQRAEASAPPADVKPNTHPPEQENMDTKTVTASMIAVPRPVMQLVGMLALIGIFVGAYFAIVGGGGGAVDENNGELAGDKDSAEWGEPSPPTESPEPVDIAAAPSLQGDQPQQDLFINSPAGESEPSLPGPEDVSDAKGSRGGSAAVEPETSVVLDPQFEENSGLADSSPDGGSRMQDDLLGDFGLDFGPAQGNQRSTDVSLQPEDRSNGITPAIESPQLGQTVDVKPQGYPVTDPSRYQYPEDYHMMFQASSDTSNTQEASPGPSERGGYGQYPGTARLRPPIDPPRVR